MQKRTKIHTSSKSKYSLKQQIAFFTLIFTIIVLFVTSLVVTIPYTRVEETPPPPEPTAPATSSKTSTDKTPLPPRFNIVDKNEAAPRIPILMYHDVQTIDSSNNANVIPTRLLEEQIQFLKKEGYTTLTMQEFIDAYNGKILVPKKSVLLTFDDGFKSIYTRVSVLMKKYDVRATSFVIGSYVDRPEWHLTKDEIQKLSAEGFIDFESHTYNLHQDGANRGILNEISEEKFKDDNNKFEEVLGHKPRVLAYPFGIFNNQSMNYLKSVNIQFGFAIKSGTANWVELNETKKSPFGDVQNPLALPRVRINGNTTLEAFKGLITDTVK